MGRGWHSFSSTAPLQEPETLEAAKALVECHCLCRTSCSVPPADETVREVRGRASEIVEGRQRKILAFDVELSGCEDLFERDADLSPREAVASLQHPDELAQH